jgi:aspartate/methionine/tyrosine aminotransferase
MGIKNCHTRCAPWYMNYPTVINAAGLKHLTEDDAYRDKLSVCLLDIPSNPLGIRLPISCPLLTPMVLDGAYWSKAYLSGAFVHIPAHDIFVGSYSKTLGLNGIRVGWIATNDDLLAVRIFDLVKGEYNGISVPSTEIIKRLLSNFDWEYFEKTAKANLDRNRGEWSKLERFFNYCPVQCEGMFYYGTIDSKCKELLEKSEIQWMPGSRLGTYNRYGRFNLGQDVGLIRKAVKTVLENDRLK